MLIAALYDIHGNLPALEAVLAEISGLNVDSVVIGGDVLPGPMPRATITLLRSLPIPIHFIYGNGEVAVLEELSGRIPANVPPPHRAIISWTAEQLDSEDQTFLSAWPKTKSIDIPGVGRVLFCHATPRNENEIFTRSTPDARLLPLAEGINAQVVVCGHTHMQFDRTVANVRVVNAGSVGMPFGLPGADWLLLGPGVQLRHTDYNLQAAAERIRNTSYPQAQTFAADNVLQPPSAEKMLELFGRAEMK